MRSFTDGIKKVPMMKCKTHGMRPVGFQCMACAQAQVNQMGRYQTALKEAHGHLISAAQDCERFGKRIERLEFVIEEIADVACAWLACSEGNHHAFCGDIQRLVALEKEETKLEDAAATEHANGAGGQLVAGTDDSAAIRADGDCSLGSRNSLNNEGDKNGDGEKVPEETADNRSVPVGRETRAAADVDDDSVKREPGTDDSQREQQPRSSTD